MNAVWMVKLNSKTKILESNPESKRMMMNKKIPLKLNYKIQRLRKNLSIGFNLLKTKGKRQKLVIQMKQFHKKIQKRAKKLKKCLLRRSKASNLSMEIIIISAWDQNLSLCLKTQESALLPIRMIPFTLQTLPSSCPAWTDCQQKLLK